MRKETRLTEKRRVSSARVASESRTQKQPTQREKEEHEATHVPFRDWALHDGKRSHPSSCRKTEE